MKTLLRLLACLPGLASLPGLAQAPGAELILVRSTAKSPAQVVDAIKAHVDADEKKWLFLGANTVKPKEGEVTMVKVCAREVGRTLWPVGLHLSAMLPCGNFGVYRKEGRTEVALLHPRYMQILHPHPEVDKAVAAATPLLLEMLEAVVR